jgi:hypothetical protein
LVTDKVFSEHLPAINLAHVDLTGCEQRPEQHGGGVCRRQHGLGFDPSLELFVQPLVTLRDEDICRIISARKATRHEQDRYYAGNRDTW